MAAVNYSLPSATLSTDQGSAEVGAALDDYVATVAADARYAEALPALEEHVTAIKAALPHLLAAVSGPNPVVVSIGGCATPNRAGDLETEYLTISITEQRETTARIVNPAPTTGEPVPVEPAPAPEA
jgi:hypothetical protein